MSYRNLESAFRRRARSACLLLLTFAVSACSGTGYLPRNSGQGEGAEGGDAASASADTSRITSSYEDQQATPASEARAFLDEATYLIESAVDASELGEHLSAEVAIKEAHLVLLEADQLVPTRFHLEAEVPRTEEDVILHEAMLRFRDEFERLWNRSNAFYDQLLPNLRVTVLTSDISEEGEEMALEEMNAALDETDAPAPGSWQEIRNLLLGMEVDGLIDIDMGLEEYSDYAWTRIYWCIQYYTGRGRNNFRIWLERSGRYRQLVEDALVEEGLPRDMVFHCMPGYGLPLHDRERFQPPRLFPGRRGGAVAVHVLHRRQVRTEHLPD